MPLRPSAIAPRHAIDAFVSAPAGPASASAEAPSATAIATRALLGCSSWFLIETPSRFCLLAAPSVGAAASYPARELTEPRDGNVDPRRCLGESSYSTRIAPKFPSRVSAWRYERVAGV